MVVDLGTKIRAFVSLFEEDLYSEPSKGEPDLSDLDQSSVPPLHPSSHTKWEAEQQNH